jgi:6-phosphogluconate dehydrogenase
MKLAMVGLGRMGGNMAERLLADGHEVIVYDVNPSARQALAAKGGLDAPDLAGVVAALQPPRVVWVMLPAGPVTNQAIDTLETLLSAGDIIVEGGNSNYSEAIAGAKRLAEHGIHLVDAGVSGGIWGRTEGYCLMVGGHPDAVTVVEPAFVSLAPPGGYAHVGPPGAGHFTKMVHNGIEYGLMQAYAEGFELLRSAEEFQLDVHEISAIWRYGSVVRSWLLELIERALAEDPNLAGLRGWVDDSGEGRWTVEEAVRRGVPAPVITASLFARFTSRQPDAYQAKLLAAMRNQFGGHAVHTDAGTTGPIGAPG